MLVIYLFTYCEQLVSNSHHTAAMVFAVCGGHFQTMKSYSQGRCSGLELWFSCRSVLEAKCRWVHRQWLLSAEWVLSRSAIGPCLPPVVGTLWCSHVSSPAADGQCPPWMKAYTDPPRTTHRHLLMSCTQDNMGTVWCTYDSVQCSWKSNFFLLSFIVFLSSEQLNWLLQFPYLF